MEQRNSKLISALATTTDPSQFAEIVRQGAQMDMTCVQVVPDALKALNIDIPKLAINVNTDQGNSYWFGSPQNSLDEESCLVVNLILRKNHYQPLGGFTSYQIPRGQAGENNCLYEALTEAIPKLLEVSAADFRLKLADCIESNPEIRQDIRSGRHQNLLQCGVFGGSDSEDEEEHIKKISEAERRERHEKRQKIADIQCVTGCLGTFVTVVVGVLCPPVAIAAGVTLMAVAFDGAIRR